MTRVAAAKFTAGSYDQRWEDVQTECPHCHAPWTHRLKCRRRKNSRCKRLASYHTHWACFACGQVWLAAGWKD